MKQFIILVSLALSILLPTCAAPESESVRATRAWLDAFTKYQFDAISNGSCPELKQSLDQDRAYATVRINVVMSGLKPVMKFDFSQLKFEEKKNDGNAATVHVSGQVSKSYADTKVMSIDKNIDLINQNGKWEVCGTPLSSEDEIVWFLLP